MSVTTGWREGYYTILVISEIISVMIEAAARVEG